MNSDCRDAAMRDLRDQQFRFASREKKLAAIRRAEDLLIETDTAIDYSYVEIHRALTCQAPQTHLDDWISGGKSPVNVANIRSRLHVTDNSSHANKLTAGKGLDWFWATYTKDSINRKAIDLLN